MSSQSIENLKKMGASDEVIEYFEMLEGLADNGLIIKCTEDSSDHLITMINEIVLSKPSYPYWKLMFIPSGAWVEINGRPFSQVYSIHRKALLECLAKLKLNMEWRNKQWVKTE